MSAEPQEGLLIVGYGGRRAFAHLSTEEMVELSDMFLHNGMPLSLFDGEISKEHCHSLFLEGLRCCEPGRVLFLTMCSDGVLFFRLLKQPEELGPEPGVAYMKFDDHEPQAASYARILRDLVRRSLPEGELQEEHFPPLLPYLQYSCVTEDFIRDHLVRQERVIEETLQKLFKIESAT